MATTANQTRASGNNPVNGDALKNIDKLADQAAQIKGNAKTEQPKTHPRVSHSLLVSSIVQASGTFKSAINLEVAVCVAVFAEFRTVNLAAKKELLSVYREAGYKCEVGGGGADYKTVNRRMGYAAEFFNSLEPGTVEEWMGDETQDSAALQSVVNRLTVEYNFRSMSDVLLAAGKTPPAKQVKQQTAKKAATPPEPVVPAKRVTASDQKVIDAAKARFEKGNAPTKLQSVTLAKHGINLEEKKPSEADIGVMNEMGRVSKDRRETDKASWLRLNFQGATLCVPRDMKSQVLGDLGIKLMAVANQMKGDKIDAKVLTEAFSETFLTH